MTPLPEGTPILSPCGRPGVVAVADVAPSGERVEGLRVDGEVGG